MRNTVPFLLILFLFCQNIYSDAVYHLKETVSVGTADVALTDMIAEPLPGKVRLRLKAGQVYSNSEISAILMNLGFGDFILIGGASDVKALPEENDLALQTAPGTDTAEWSGNMASEMRKNADKESFFLRVIDRNSGDAILKKGPITIVTRVRIMRRSGDGYLVQNPFSGRKFTVPAEESPQAN